MTSTKIVQIMPIMPMGHKWACPWGYMWYIGLYRENIKKSSCLKPQGIELWYLVCSITKTSGPLPSLFKLWSRSTKFVQIMTLGPKMVLSQGATCFTQAYGKHEKIFLYETTNHRKVIRLQRSGIDTIKYHTWPRIQIIEPWYLIWCIT